MIALKREQILKPLQLTQDLLFIYQDNTLFLCISTCSYFNYSGILVLVNREGVMGDVMVAGSGHSNHEIVEFKIFRVMRKKDSIVATLKFRRANFKLFRELFSRVPC